MQNQNSEFNKALRDAAPRRAAVVPVCAFPGCLVVACARPVAEVEVVAASRSESSQFQVQFQSPVSSLQSKSINSIQFGSARFLSLFLLSSSTQPQTVSAFFLFSPSLSSVSVLLRLTFLVAPSYRYSLWLAFFVIFYVLYYSVSSQPFAFTRTSGQTPCEAFPVDRPLRLISCHALLRLPILRLRPSKDQPSFFARSRTKQWAPINVHSDRPID